MKKLSIAIFIAGTSLISTAQDPHFSQYNTAAPLLINPANAGMIPANLRMNLAYRSQWGSVTTPFRTFMFSGDYRIPLNKEVSLGVGLNTYRDVAGDTKFGTTLAQFAVSSIVKLDDNQRISAGIMGGIVQKGMNSGDLQWDSQYQGGQYNAANPSGETINFRPGMMPDVSAGVVYNFRNDEGYMTSNDMLDIKVGISWQHITRPKMKFMDADTLYSNFVGFAEATIGISNTRWSVVPSVLAMMQGPSKELYVGALAKYRLQQAAKITGLIKGAYMYMGAYYRHNDAVAPTVMFEFDQYALGISYDVNISSLAVASSMRGGLEITFRFMNPSPYLYKGTKASFR